MNLIFRIWLLSLLLGSHVNPQSSSLLAQYVRNCSFFDPVTGFQAVWHTQCSGRVNFVVNFPNFPQPGGFTPPGLPPENYWIAIGFKLLFKWEMVVIESQNGNVVISSGKFVSGQPPQRNSFLDSLIISNPQGQFLGNSLEASFSIDEAILSGCKEWTFFSKPTRVLSSYTGQIHAKVVCNVSEACSRADCSQAQYFDPFYLDYVKAPTNQNSGSRRFFMNKRLYGDNNNDNNNQLNPSLQQQNLLNPTMRSLSPSLQGLNNNPLLSSMNPLLQNNFQQQIPTLSPLPAPQNPIPPYLSSSYGYGYPSSSSAFDAGGTPLDYNYYSTAGQQQQQYSSQLAQQLGNGGGMYGPTKTSSNWPLYYEPMYSLYYPLYDPSRLRPQQQSAGGGGGGPLAYQLGGQQQGSLLSDIDKNIIYFNAMNPVVQLQRRKKRQTSWPQTSSSLQGTAYEGQDRQFIRQPIDLSQYQLNPQYKYYDQLPMSFGKTTTMEGGVSTFERNHPQPQYYPYGTAVENDNLSGPQNQQNLANQQQNLLANTQNQQQQNFAASHQNQQNWPGLQSRWDQRREMASGQAASRPIKPRGICEAVDPEHCVRYVDQMKRWLQGNNLSVQQTCSQIQTWLLNSDNQCCNSLRAIGCGV